MAWHDAPSGALVCVVMDAALGLEGESCYVMAPARGTHCGDDRVSAREIKARVIPRHACVRCGAVRDSAPGAEEARSGTGMDPLRRVLACDAMAAWGCTGERAVRWLKDRA